MTTTAKAPGRSLASLKLPSSLATVTDAMAIRCFASGPKGYRVSMPEPRTIYFG